MDYAIENVILIGPQNYPLYRFTKKNILVNTISGVFSVDPVGNELSIDTFSVTIRHDPGGGDLRQLYAPVGADAYKSPNGAVYSLATQLGRDYMAELPYGTPVYWFCDGSLFRKAYLKTVQRLTRFSWKLTCISGVGLLDDDYHVGGIYSGSRFADVAAEVIGETFPYEVDAAIADEAVYGWLPYATRRKNLHDLLFSMGVSLLRGTGENDYKLAFIDPPTSPAVIPTSRIAIGGSVNYELPATGVEVTEHAYLSGDGDETVTLYDSTDPNTANSQTVVFSEPCHDLTASGSLVIEESGVNYAKVTGHGILTGQRFAHYTTLVTLGGGNGSQRIKRVETQYLISQLNSYNVARRVLAYFASAKTVAGKIQLLNEAPGYPYQFTDAFGDTSVGYLKQMTVGVTSIKAASVQLIEGFTPTGQGNNYKSRVQLTGSGTFTVTATRHRIVLIGGGAGGETGHTGGSGISSQHGGEGGAGGKGGKIYAFELDGLTIGDTISYICGVGGDSDQDGTDTVFGSFSSASGVVYDPGYIDIIGGTRVGYPGSSGVSGADSGQALTFEGVAYQPGAEGASVNFGGTSVLYGGGGGGAAAGGNGNVGGDAAFYDIGGVGTAFCGNGGGGANATIPGADATEYGCGGNGGHGGGQGGLAGSYNNLPPVVEKIQEGAPGPGGAGSLGGKGGAGCIYVYS